MKSQLTVPMRLHPGTVSVTGKDQHQLILPDNCAGILFVFKSKAAAKQYCVDCGWGANTNLMHVEANEEDEEP